MVLSSNLNVMYKSDSTLCFRLQTWVPAAPSTGLTRTAYRTPSPSSCVIRAIMGFSCRRRSSTPPAQRPWGPWRPSPRACWRIAPDDQRFMWGCWMYKRFPPCPAKVCEPRTETQQEVFSSWCWMNDAVHLIFISCTFIYCALTSTVVKRPFCLVEQHFCWNVYFLWENRTTLIWLLYSQDQRDEINVLYSDVFSVIFSSYLNNKAVTGVKLDLFLFIWFLVMEQTCYYHVIVTAVQEWSTTNVVQVEIMKMDVTFRCT